MLHSICSNFKDANKCALIAATVKSKTISKIELSAVFFENFSSKC